MKKLRLELEELAVESFVTAQDSGGGRGTVRGQQIAVVLSQFLWECPGSWDAAGCASADTGCYTADPAGATCQAVYTCPECAQTDDLCDTMRYCDTMKYCDTVKYCG